MYDPQAELRHQFEMVFKLIEQAIEHGNEGSWAETEDDWSYSYRLYHLMESIDFYLNDTYQGFIFGGRLDVNSKEISKSDYLKIIGTQPKSMFVSYLDEIKTRTNGVLQMDVKTLQSGDEFADWGFLSRQHKFNYVLMHSTFHLGELAYNLKINNQDHMKW